MMTVYVCFDKDSECGNNPANWCLGCPKRGLTQVAVAPHAAAGPYPTQMRQATPEEAVWLRNAAFRSARVVPIDMILHCPRCGMQHIDAPDRLEDIVHDQSGTVVDQLWTNPPHRSHLCHGCKCVWRPADVPTNGVAAVKTRGQADTWPDGVAPSQAPSFAASGNRIMAAVDNHTAFNSANTRHELRSVILAELEAAALGTAPSQAPTPPNGGVQEAPRG